MARKRGAGARQESFKGEERNYRNLDDVTADIAPEVPLVSAKDSQDETFREALKGMANRSASSTVKSVPPPRPMKSPTSKNSKKQQRHPEKEDIDHILNSMKDSDAGTVNDVSVFSKAVSNAIKQTPLRILAIVLILVLLFALKSGEDQYHSMITSTHSLEVDPYELLGVSPTANRADLRRAYRKLSLEWHPDKRDGCDETCRLTFKQISEAYKLLSDPKRRSLYDQTQKVTDGSTTAFFSNMQTSEYLLTRQAWDSIVAPSLDHRQLWTPPEVSGVWAFLIADPRSEWTEHLIPFWTELAAKFYGRISFMRVDVTDPLADKVLPVKLRITPAIMTLTSGGVPNVYDKMLSFQPRHLVGWLQDSVPDVLRRWTGTPGQLENLLLRERRTADGRVPVVMLSGRAPATLHKALALRTLSIFDWIRVDDAKTAEALAQYFPRMEASAKGAILAPNAFNESISSIQLPKSHWQLDKVELRINEEQEDLLESAAALEHTQLTTKLLEIIRSNEVPIYEENLPYLCKSKDELVRVLCLIRINPPHCLTAEQARMDETFWNSVNLLDHVDEDEDIVEAEESEPEEIATSQDQIVRIVQHVSLDSRPLGALGSALTRLGQNGKKTLTLDLASASYAADQEVQWFALPKQCHTHVGKPVSANWITRRFISHSPCGPRWKLSPREALRYWWAGHPILATIIPASLVAMIIMWPRSKYVEPPNEGVHEHSD